MGTIQNAANTPLNQSSGTVPNVNGALQEWFQPMVFVPIVKSTVGGEVVELGDPINFRGVIQPLSNRDLIIKPEGQRAWTWYMLHSDTCLRLKVDDVVNYLGVQTRVMGFRDYAIYGYLYYELVQDYTGAGPEVPET